MLTADYNVIKGDMLLHMSNFSLWLVQELGTIDHTQTSLSICLLNLTVRATAYPPGIHHGGRRPPCLSLTKYARVYI